MPSILRLWLWLSLLPPLLVVLVLQLLQLLELLQLLVRRLLLPVQL